MAEPELQLLLDERAIRRRLHAYTHALDYGHADNFAACFTEDGALEIVSEIPNARIGTDSRTRRIEGRDALRAFVADHIAPPDAYFKHLTAETQIEVDGDRATALSTFVQIDESPDGPVVTSFGLYRDTLARCADGEWRIAQRIGELENRVASRDGLRVRR
jgi:ketosteroid isomerase-like protein